LARANPGRKVSVIIPARDEERNLRKLLPALAGQSMPPHEIIVVDDQSSDGTAAIARAAGAKLIEGRDLPEGWFGKPWACHQGAEAASGEWLWFLDADVEPETEALERLSGLMTPDSVISVCPWHRTEQLYEQLSVFFNLLMVGGIGASTWRGDAAPGIGLFGQCLLIPRPVYDAVGGHAAVRQTVLENFHLSRLLEKEGVRKVSRIGRGSISMRMFPDGYEQLRESWVKGFASGAGLTSKPALVLCSIWLSGLMTLLVSTLLMPLADPVSRALTGLAFFAGGLGLVRLFRQVGGFAWWSALAFPLALVFYLQVFVKSVRRRHGGQKTQWKGRDVA
jgi:4,4'-diaponeurosporenoate glycosyltransferase